MDRRKLTYTTSVPFEFAEHLVAQRLRPLLSKHVNKTQQLEARFSTRSTFCELIRIIVRDNQSTWKIRVEPVRHCGETIRVGHVIDSLLFVVHYRERRDIFVRRRTFIDKIRTHPLAAYHDVTSSAILRSHECQALNIGLQTVIANLCKLESLI